MNAKKYYLIYKITNNVNQKFYIGKHETNNLDDDYFGSGKHLMNAQNKYGLENFTKTILFYCQSREEMNLLEHCVVTPEFCQREDVYNIMEGGDGGWSYVNSEDIWSHESRSKAQIKRFQNLNEREANSIRQKEVLRKNPDIVKKWNNAGVKGYKAKQQLDPTFMRGSNNLRYCKPLSDSARKHISIAMKTDSNFMKNSKWYCCLELELNLILDKSLSMDNYFLDKRIINFKHYYQQLADKQMNEIAKQEHTLKLKELQETFFTAFYFVYLEKGFNAMCEQFGLSDLLQSSFCHLCKKRVVEYKKYKRYQV